MQADETSSVQYLRTMLFSVSEYVKNWPLYNVLSSNYRINASNARTYEHSYNGSDEMTIHKQ